MNEEDLQKIIAVCAAEPIHIPGKIQPHGFMIVFVEVDHTIVQTSANCVSILGISSEAAVGKSLDVFLTPDSTRSLSAALGGEDLRSANPLRIKLANVSNSYDGILSRSDSVVVLELEPFQEERTKDMNFFYSHIHSLIQSIQTRETLTGTFNFVASEVKKLTGFDRVLIYEFDAEFHGKVVGEAKQPFQDSYMDHRYPASDIPPQARQLYLRNWLRIIPDIEYEPSPLIPEVNPIVGGPLDMSGTVLRSVSPVHIQYLRNFGVRSSMSISIIKDGQLWGLITCTHLQTRFVPYDVRSICEFIGQIMSLHISRITSQVIYEKKLQIHTLLTETRQHLIANGVATGYVQSASKVLRIADASGSALVINNEVHSIGATPAHEEIKRLTIWLRQNQNHFQSFFVTDRLSEMFPDGGNLLGTACGVLAVPLDTVHGNYILWFRPEIIQTVKWAGDPRKNSHIDEGEKLMPRRSFAVWKEQVSMRSEPWQSWEMEGAKDLGRSITDIVLHTEMSKLNIALEAKALELEALSKAKDEFLALVSHELRSPLSVILGYAELLRHDKPGSPLFRKGIEAIHRNARTQAQLIGDLLDVSRIVTGKLSLDLQVVRLSEVIADAVDAIMFSTEKKGINLETRVDETLTTMRGDAKRLKQVLWNLLSNAVKFTPKGGKITLEAQRRLSMVEFRVSDTGQGIMPSFLPYVFDRFKQESLSAVSEHGGLGLGLAIVKHIAELHNGSVYAESAGKGTGASFVVTMPIASSPIGEATFVPHDPQPYH